MKTNYKLVIFHDDSIPGEILANWSQYRKIVLCRYDLKDVLGDSLGLVGTIIRYLPMFTDVIPYNYGTIADSDRHPGQWKRDFSSFSNVISAETDMMVYNIPLAGELLTRNIASREFIPLKGWYRISAYPIVFKYGNQLPITLMDEFLFDTTKTKEYDQVVNYILQYEYEKAHPCQGKFVYGCDELFLLNVMKYHEDNELPYIFSVNVYTHRSPFYYWLEYVKPNEEKQLEFLRRVGSTDNSVSEFLKKYDNKRRQDLYNLIKDKFGSDLGFFEDRTIAECINRFIAYNDKPQGALYCKKF